MDAQSDLALHRSDSFLKSLVRFTADGEKAGENFRSTDEESNILLSPNLRPKLTHCDACGIYTVLTSAVEELEYLEYAILGRVYDEWSDIANYQTLTQRYSYRDQSRTLLFPNIDGVKILSEAEKIQRDRLVAAKIIHRTLAEIKENNSFESLRSYTNSVIRQRKDNAKLVKEHKNNVKSLRRLEDKLKTNERKGAEAIRLQNEKITMKTCQLHDELMTTYVKLKFMRRYEAARSYLHKFRVASVENGLLSEIENTRLSIDLEQRVQAEVCRFIDVTQTEYEDDIENWMNDYDRDVEIRDNQIMKAKMDREALFERTSLLMKEYQSNKKEMEDYLDFKERQRIAAELFIVRTENAIKIQAWWRGLMVRKQLGPFKPNKQPKSKNAKDKNKKKKK